MKDIPEPLGKPTIPTTPYNISQSIFFSEVNKLIAEEVEYPDYAGYSIFTKRYTLPPTSNPEDVKTQVYFFCEHNKKPHLIGYNIDFNNLDEMFVFIKKELEVVLASRK